MRIFVSILLTVLTLGLQGQLRTVNNQSFEAGEELKYVLHYGIFNAGEATLKVKKTKPNKKNEREQLYVEGIGKTTGTFSWFFKVYDEYASTIDAEGVFPYHFKRRVDEGGYKISQDYYFNHDEDKLVTQKKEEFPISKYSQDMISAFYYARTLNFDTAKIGDVYRFQSFVDEKEDTLRIKYLGKRFVDIRNGKYRVMAFCPVVIEGNVFENDEALVVYISDDKNRVPVLAEAKILVGSVKMELESYKNLMHPMAKVP
jgi:hypothetical protein